MYTRWQRTLSKLDCSQALTKLCWTRINLSVMVFVNCKFKTGINNAMSSSNCRKVCSKSTGHPSSELVYNTVDADCLWIEFKKLYMGIKTALFTNFVRNRIIINFLLHLLVYCLYILLPMKSGAIISIISGIFHHWSSSSNKRGKVGEILASREN